MKKLLFLSIFFCYLLPVNTFAQITKETLIGKWVLVDFAMQAKNKNAKLTKQETETAQIMKQVIQAQPKSMTFTFKEDGTLLAEPITEDSDGNATWKLKNNTLSITSGKKKKTEEYTLSLIDNKNLEFKVLKSKGAIPVMTFEKE
jgi:C-terminal lipocalin-like domain